EEEGFDRFRLPQAQQVRRGHPVAGDRCVVGDAFDDSFRNPADPVPPLIVVKVFGSPTEIYVEGDFRMDDLPGVAEAKPFVGQLDLPAVVNRLIEYAEFVTDSVADF